MNRKTHYMLLVLICLVFAGCSNRFGSMPFVHGSYAYVTYKDAVVQMSGEPEQIARELSDVIRESGGVIVERTKLDWYPSFSPQTESCWTVRKEFLDKLAAAYDKNSFSDYKEIDFQQACKDHHFTCAGDKRECRGCGCSYYELEKNGDFTSFIIMANIDPRTSTTTIQRYNPIAVGGITGGFTSNHATQLPFLSRLKITVWKRAGEKKSSVMFEAVPVEARKMIEAQWDMYIGHDWWGEVNGKREAELVKIYKTLAEDMEYKKQSVKGK